MRKAPSKPARKPIAAKSRAGATSKSKASKSKVARKQIKPAARKAAKSAVAKATPIRSTPVKASPVKTPRKSAVVVAHKPKPTPAPVAVLAPVAVPPPATSNVVNVVEHALGEMKAANVKVLDVHELTDIADILVIASGNSDRHVRAIADRVVEEAKKSGFRPMGVEGERDGEWVLVDLQDVIVHIMLPRVREFYRLESLWDVSAARREAMQSA